MGRGVGTMVERETATQSVSAAHREPPPRAFFVGGPKHGRVEPITPLAAKSRVMLAPECVSPVSGDPWDYPAIREHRYNLWLLEHGDGRDGRIVDSAWIATSEDAPRSFGVLNEMLNAIQRLQ